MGLEWLLERRERLPFAVYFVCFLIACLVPYVSAINVTVVRESLGYLPAGTNPFDLIDCSSVASWVLTLIAGSINFVIMLPFLKYPGRRWVALVGLLVIWAFIALTGISVSK